MKTVSALSLVVLALSSATLSAASVTPVMIGLDNPRGLAFGPEGALYVVEAGRGGTDSCAVLRGALRCQGPSGALSRLWNGTQQRVAVGFPSYTDAGVTETTGAHDVVFLGRGHATVSIGFGGDPAQRDLFGPAGAGFGTLLQVSASGRWQFVADVSAHEAAANPAGGPVDTNPYGLLAEPGATVVADAGANALLRVAANGEVSTIASFRSRPSSSTDSVTTSVTKGPDGAYYVGELTGAPFAAGAARVYRVVPGAAPEIFLTGFKTIIDLDFGPDGSLYVLQYATGAVFFPGPGQVIRVLPDGTRSVVVDGLSFPTGVLAAPDGSLYISNRGTSVLTGEVLHAVF